MNQTIKRSLSVLLAVLMLLSVCATQLAFAASAVGKVAKLEVASVSQNQVKLKWSKVSKASGYCVYSYDTKSGRWLVETYTTKLAYTDKELAAGTKYTYKVAAYVKSGTSRTFGKDSDKVTALTKPARVAKVTAKQVTPAKIKLTWAAAQGAAGYVVYGRTAEGKYKKLATVKKNTYTAKYKAAPGLMYYKVRAFAKSGKLKQAAKDSAAVKVNAKPAMVKSLTATNIGGASATLKWKAAAGASAYIIFKKDVGTDGKFVKLATTKQTTYTVSYPASPRTAYFSVQAKATVNGVTTLAPVSDPVYVSMWPKAVTLVTVKEAGHDSLTLEWPKADGASEYHVYQYVDGELKELGTTDKTTFVVKGLESETIYSFRVRAVAVYKGQVTETEISPVLTAMTSFGTVKGATVVLNTSNTAALSWNALEGAEGYVIEKKDGESWKQIGDVKTTMFSVSDVEPDKTLGVAQTYEYRIRAYLKAEGETVYSPYTNVLELHSLPAKPEKPLAAAGSGMARDSKDATKGNYHTIVVDWPVVAGADGYQLQFYRDGKWVDEGKVKENDVLHTYTHNGTQRMSYSFIMDGAQDTGYHQYRVAAAVLNDGRWTCAAYSEPVTIDYVYEQDYGAPNEVGGKDVTSYVVDVSKEDSTVETQSDLPTVQGRYQASVQGPGLVGYLLDPEEGVFYTADDPWQRNFGFNPLYDLASQAIWIQYDTTRYKFNYQGSEWMLQPWKGQYGAVLYGAELGVYRKYKPSKVPHYDCAENNDRLLMSMDFERYYYDQEDSTKGEWKHEFYRPYGTYWWCTGFKLGYIRLDKPLDIILRNEVYLITNGKGVKKQTYPEIRANYRVTMKDFEMLYAFVDSLKGVGYQQVDYYKGVKPDTWKFAVNGLDVYFPF